MAIKLIATDLNGTLLHNDQTFNQALLQQVLAELTARNIPLVLSSGNQYAHLAQLFQPVMTPNLAIVAENGASIYLNGQQVFDGSLTPAQVTHFLTVDRQQAFLQGAYLILVGQQGSYTEVGAPADLLAAAGKFYDHLQTVTDLSQVTDRIKKISIATNQVSADQLVPLLNTAFAGSLVAHDSGYGVVDVVAASVGKLPAIQWLAQRWQITADELLAFGDGANDLPLLQFAGHGFAMQNAPAAVQTVANQVTELDNQHDGVLTTIQQVVLR